MELSFSSRFDLIDELPSSATIRLGGSSLTIERCGFGDHLRLLDFVGRLSDAAEVRDLEVIEKELLGLVKRFTGCEFKVLLESEFVEVFEAFQTIQSLNSLRFIFPFLEEEATQEPPHWHYEGRARISLLHEIAAAYGWELKEIEALDPDEALGFIQEILVDRQLDREWSYSLSEVAYQYNKATKKSHFRPLPRPAWMLSRKPKITKILKRAMPVGNIIVVGGTV